MNELLADPFHRQRSCVLVVDVVESVRLIQKDEDATIRRWLMLVEKVKSQLNDGKVGRVVKSLGDGLLLQFDEVPAALKVAFSVIEAARVQNATVAEDQKVHLRVGMEVSEVLVGADDIYGHGVNMAARLATLAKPGEIVVSTSVRDEVTADIHADIEDMGECFLKHVADPVRAYRIGPPGHRPVLLSAVSLASMLPTVAVIPFQNGGTVVMGEVLAEELIRALSQSDRVNVISRMSTRAFRNSLLSSKEIGEHLKANYVLNGRCRHDGERVTLLLELSESRSNAIVWAEPFQAQIRDVLNGGQEMIANIVGQIGKTILQREFERARTLPLPTVESYGLLLGAIASMYRLSRSEFERAGEMLEHLIEREPRQPLPLAWMGSWHVLKVQQGWTDDANREGQLAQARTGRALDLDSENDQALTIDGLVRTNLLRDFSTAEDRYSHAISNNPNASMAWLLKGMMHAFRGEGGVAVDFSKRAQSLSPLDPQKFYYDCLTSAALIANEQYESAETFALNSLKANSTHTSTLRVLAIAQWQLDKFEESRKTVTKLMVLEPDLTIAKWQQNNPSARYSHGKNLAKILKDAGVPG